MADLNAALSNNKQTLKAADKKQQTHHYAVGLFVSSFLHQAGQLTEVLLVLLQESWGSITEGNAHNSVTWRLLHMHNVFTILQQKEERPRAKHKALAYKLYIWQYVHASVMCTVIIILTV